MVLLSQAAKDTKGKNKLRAEAEAGGRLLDFPPALFANGKNCTKAPLALLRHQAKVAEAIKELTSR